MKLAKELKEKNKKMAEEIDNLTEEIVDKILESGTRDKIKALLKECADYDLYNNILIWTTILSILLNFYLLLFR